MFFHNDIFHANVPNQALEPISSITKPGWSTNAVNIVDDEGVSGDDATTTTISYPVDVIVYFHMKSNQFQFSCMPVSRLVIYVSNI